MCGICGIVKWSGADDGHRARSRAMCDEVEHRGPDDRGLESDDRAVLGATRLSIRGSTEGRQPQRESKTGVIVVCNGEIDNHGDLRRGLLKCGRDAAPGSDVTVLTHLYAERGDEFVEALEGSFALALWDPARDKLLLARDRAGERPLFYSAGEDEVVFATELSALVLDSTAACSVDLNAMRHYLRFGRFPAPLTPLRKFRKLAPGELICFSPSGRCHRRYWQWALGSTRRTPSVEAFDNVFVNAVRRQTDCDADFGVFLSGGIDSSLVAAVTRRLHPDRSLRSYTLRFSETSYDEGAAAMDVAERLDLDNISVWVSAEDFPVKIRELVRMTGEPLGDPAWVPTALLAERAAQDVKMVLVGEGGDEVFGGYPTYLGALLADRFDRLPKPVRRGFSWLVRLWPASDRKVTLPFLLKRFVDGVGMEPLARHVLWSSAIPPTLLARLGAEQPAVETPAIDAEVLDVVQRHDLEGYLAEGLLTKADRASLGWALEPRAPFLDRNVLEFAATLPPDERVRGLTTKVFLKRYALRYLPRSVVHRRKRGLSVPLAAWFRGPLHEWARERRASGLLQRCGITVRSSLDLLEEHALKRADQSRGLWLLLVLTEWLEWLETADERHVVSENRGD